MIEKKYKDGLVIVGDAFSNSVGSAIRARFDRFPLIICDPPYGKIVKSKNWDDIAEYNRWFAHCVEHAADFATIVMWGGAGKPGHRPFLEWVATVETAYPEWEGMLCTWAKKRAYGVPDDYLYCREEVFILYRGPRGKTGKPAFNIPLLEKLRGYAGYNEKYPAKSEFLRRTNVWTDITEIFKGKIHEAQKPDPLYKVLVETHSNKGDMVYDPCAGSGTTARACIATGRKFVIVEQSRGYLEKAGLV